MTVYAGNLLIYAAYCKYTSLFDLPVSFMFMRWKFVNKRQLLSCFIIEILLFFPNFVKVTSLSILTFYKLTPFNCISFKLKLAILQQCNRTVIPYLSSIWANIIFQLNPLTSIAGIYLHCRQSKIRTSNSLEVLEERSPLITKQLKNRWS